MLFKLLQVSVKIKRLYETKIIFTSRILLLPKLVLKKEPSEIQGL